MKSADHKTVASQFVTFVGLTFALALGFFVVKQGMYTTKGEGETVLGTLDDIQTISIVREMNGVKYSCLRTNCDKVAHTGGLISDDSDKDKDNGKNCRSIKDNRGSSICYWSNPLLTTAQCNVDKDVYRNRGIDRGAQNLYLSEDSENVVYYNCTIVTPFPTKIPSPTPTKRPSPTPTIACSRSVGQTCGTSVAPMPNCRDGYVGCLSGLKCIKHVGQSKYTCQKPVVIATPTPIKSFVLPTQGLNCYRAKGQVCGYASTECRFVGCLEGLGCMQKQGEAKATCHTQSSDDPKRSLTPTKTPTDPKPTSAPTSKPTPTKAAPRNVI